MRLQKPKRQTDATIRLLAGVSRLHSFTLAELAGFAGVTEAAARSFLRRNKDLVEPVDSGTPNGRGRPSLLWRLNPVHGDALAEKLADLSAVVGPAPPDPAEEVPSPLDLLDLTLDALETGEIEGEDEIRRELHMAARHLAAARSNLRDRSAMRMPVPESELARLDDAEARLGRLRPALEGEVAATVSALLPAEAGGAADWQRFWPLLQDWSIRRPAAPLESRQWAAAVPVDRILDELFSKAIWSGGPNEATVLMPAAALLSLDDRPAGFRDALSAWLSRRMLTVSAPVEGCALMVAAAALDMYEMSQLLFRLLLDPHNNGLQDEALRATSFIALARLARPRPDGGVDSEAARACRYMTGSPGIGPGDLAILTPGALGAASGAETGSLLRQMGTALLGEDGVKRQFRRSVDEAVLARNLALALCRDDFALLISLLDELLRKPHGRSLVRMMTRREHDAIRLTDDNGRHRFRLRLGSRPAACMDVSDRWIGFDVADDVRDHLHDMIQLTSWSDPDRKTAAQGSSGRRGFRHWLRDLPDEPRGTFQHASQ